VALRLCFDITVQLKLSSTSVGDISNRFIDTVFLLASMTVQCFAPSAPSLLQTRELARSCFTPIRCFTPTRHTLASLVRTAKSQHCKRARCNVPATIVTVSSSSASADDDPDTTAERSGSGNGNDEFENDDDAAAGLLDTTVQFFSPPGSMGDTGSLDTPSPTTAASQMSSGVDSSPEAFGSYVEIPIFPLGMVLQPGASTQLHIFEMRYRLLFQRAWDGDRRFGLIYFDSETESIGSVGCSAELTRFEPLPDGRIMTNNIGKSRFRVVNILDDLPYKRAIVDFFEDDTPSESALPSLAALERNVWAALQDVLRLSNKLYDKALDLGSSIRAVAPPNIDDLDAHVDTPENVDHARISAFSFAVSQILDMQVKEQQLLLQTRSTGFRLRKQRKMLQTARQYLAAQVTIKDAF
jgi:ATP-dependent Lon protease